MLSQNPECIENVLLPSLSLLDQPEPGSVCVVGLSGGVDSTLAAVLLKEKGCKVIGVTMSKWTGDLVVPDEGLKNSCYGPEEAKDIAACEAFCKEQGIEYHVIPVGEAYHREVLDYFKSEYRAGRTPNPCIRCNPLVKFGAMIDGVRALGITFDYFCTGHYAQLVVPEGQNGPVFIRQAQDLTKDQAYFLYRIPQETLRIVRFPLGNYTKTDVFAMAHERNLIAANREESQDFVPPEYFDLIFSDKPPVPGDIIDLDGHKLGTHRGIEYYTIGQRRGLGVSSSRPLYVHSIDAASNTVVLADNDALNEAGLIAEDWVWAGSAPEVPFQAQVKIRLASKPVQAVISPVHTSDGKMSGAYEIRFEKQQRAVAPGQSAVVYLNGTILGGGIITRAIHE